MTEPIGILGLGYLGTTLLNEHTQHPGSWATQRRTSVGEETVPDNLQTVTFDWDNSASWANLPADTRQVVLTIPPLEKDVTAEQQRVDRWGRWMRQHRPVTEKLVYISSTGVYPNRPGNWSERQDVEPDTPQGKLRLATEKALAVHFDLFVIRPGAIYGRGRHLGQRIREGLPIPQGLQPIPRIHVSDLAGIVQLALTRNDFPRIVNAVDLDPTPSPLVTEWLIQQPFAGLTPSSSFAIDPNHQTRKHITAEPNRCISNHRLVNELQYQFLFPTFREGLKNAYEG
jgi:hypothetical protein